MTPILFALALMMTAALAVGFGVACAYACMAGMFKLMNFKAAPPRAPRPILVKG